MSTCKAERAEGDALEGERNVSVLILCGGRSRRMGQDKAQLELGGLSLLERVVGVSSGFGEGVSLACGQTPRYAELGLPLVLDESSESGPIAGLVAGLGSSSQTHLLAIACDMPFLSADLFQALWARVKEQDLDVCFLESEKGREPLCAVYSRACLPFMRQALKAGNRKVTAFQKVEGAEILRSGLLPLASLQDSSTYNRLANLNTPDDLERARRVLEENQA